ncbi:MAG: T9SS type A sorting domain-containing protein, partial [Bacteroidia bacterium]|nr:T9SS type A sorting domain-containing protein [Bacteroidia bacterium]
IRLRGENPLVVDVNTPLNDPWVDASDNYYPSVIVTTSGSVLTGELGEYPITYTATDGAGNQSSVTRLVRVVDRIAPQISISGPNPIKHVRFTPYVENLEAIKITDNYYSEDTLKKSTYLRIDYSKFDESKPGFQVISIWVTDPSGNVSEFTYRYIDVETVISVEEVTSEAGPFSIYPNPTNGKFTISSKTNVEIKSIKLVDLLGRVVLTNTEMNTNAEIDLSKLNTGIYMLYIEDVKGNAYTDKITKQ